MNLTLNYSRHFLSPLTLSGEINHPDSKSLQAWLCINISRKKTNLNAVAKAVWHPLRQYSTKEYFSISEPLSPQQ